MVSVNVHHWNSLPVRREIGHVNRALTNKTVLASDVPVLAF